MLNTETNWKLFVLNANSVIFQVLNFAAAVFHYVPLHSSPGGIKYGRIHGGLFHTDEISERLVRLPIWIGMTEEDLLQVAEAVREALY